MSYLSGGERDKGTYPEFFSFLDVIADKLANPGNNRYFEIWLQRLVVKLLDGNNDFIQQYMSQSKEGLVRFTNDILRQEQTDISLFDETWIAPESRIDWTKFIDVEKIKNMNTMIGDSEIRLDLYESI